MNDICDLNLPSNVSQVLSQVTSEAAAVFNKSLRTVTLFGSAAEGRLRVTSDVNVLFVLDDFDPEVASGLEGVLRFAGSAIKLRPLILLTEELSGAAHSFAVKFFDIRRRYRVLYGEDLVHDLDIPKTVVLGRLQQVLLNEILRLRSLLLREGSTLSAFSIAEGAGPLRACATAILSLDKPFAGTSREALECLATKLGGDRYQSVLAELPKVRAGEQLPSSMSKKHLVSLMDLAATLKDYINTLR